MQEDQQEPPKNDYVVVGVDPSITSFGVSDGTRHKAIKTGVVPGDDEEHAMMKRTHELMVEFEEFLEEFGDREVRLYVEGVQLQVPSHGGSHIFQMGFVVAGILTLAQQRTYAGKITDVFFVGQTSWMRALFAKQVPDTQLAKVAFQKFGIDIENDRGLDKLDAYLIYRFGCGVRDGQWEFVQRKGRGQK